MNAVRLRKNYDGNQIFIAESGIKSSADIEYLVSNDINVFLIGESLMRGNLFEVKIMASRSISSLVG